MSATSPERLILEFPPDPSASPPGIGHLRSPIVADVIARFEKLRGFEPVRPLLWDNWGIPVARASELSGKSGAVIADEYAVAWAEARAKLALLPSTESRSNEKANAQEVGELFSKLLARGAIFFRNAPTFYCQSCARDVLRKEARNLVCPGCKSTNLVWAFRQAPFLAVKHLASRIYAATLQLDWPLDLRNAFARYFETVSGADQIYETDLGPMTVFWPARAAISTPLAIHLSPEHPLLARIDPNSDVWRNVEHALVVGSEEPVPLGLFASTAGTTERVPLFLALRVDRASTFGTGARPVIGTSANAKNAELRPVSRTRLLDLRVGSIRSWGVAVAPLAEGTPGLRVHPLFALAWYFVRESAKPYAAAPVTIGAAHHALTPMLYARCLAYVLEEQRMISGIFEPFPILRDHGVVVGWDGRKMARLHNNVVNAHETLAGHGADCTRLSMMFMGPLASNLRWNGRVMHTMERFLTAIRRWADEGGSVEADVSKVERAHSMLECTHRHMLSAEFHLAIARLRDVFRAGVPEGERRHFLQLLWTFAPEGAEYAWRQLGDGSSLADNSTHR